MPKTGPSDGSRRASMAFLPIWHMASKTPTAVTVLPSPSGVGVMAVTSMILPSGRVLEALEHGHVVDLGLVLAVELQLVVQDARLGGDLLDRQQGGSLGDLDVGLQRILLGRVSARSAAHPGPASRSGAASREAVAVLGPADELGRAIGPGRQPAGRLLTGRGSAERPQAVSEMLVTQCTWGGNWGSIARCTPRTDSVCRVTPAWRASRSRGCEAEAGARQAAPKRPKAAACAAA